MQDRHGGLFLSYHEIFRIYSKGKSLPEGMVFNEASFRPSMIDNKNDPLWKFNFRKPTTQEIYDIQKEHAKIKEQEEYDQKVMQKGNQDKEVCSKVLSYIRGHVSKRNLTATKYQAFYEYFKSITEALNFTQPEIALAYLKKMKCDDSLIKKELVNKLIEMLSVFDARTFYQHVEHIIVDNNTNASTLKFKELRRCILDKLKESDFTQLADAPISTDIKKLYREYRQYLRGLPSQHNNITILKAKVPSFEIWLKERT